MKINKIILLFFCVVLVGGIDTLAAQNTTLETGGNKKKTSKAWEFGVGASIFQFSRSQFSDFTELKNEGYNFNLKLKHAVYGGNLYVARELSKHLYLDFQGTIGAASDRINDKDKTKMLLIVGPGLQWRLGEYFGSRYIDPYLRAGINYMNKGFSIHYQGMEGLSEDQMNWILTNDLNKNGRDKEHLMPVSIGGGLNLWLNDRFGIGLQADYLIMPYREIANSLQGTARVMFRLGGKSKKAQPVIQYVDRDRIIEQIVEKPIEVEKIVERVEYTKLYELFNNIYFDFDQATLTASTEKVMDEIAAILKQNDSKKYLITGYTDAIGTPEYNLDLSKRRAAAVVEALIKRDVPSSILKSVGVGKKISHMSTNATEDIREGDRKVTIELITNKGYWDSLPFNN